MYKRKVKGRQTEYQNSIKKFLEQTRDPLKRLKSLKHGLEKSSADEIKEFYMEHSSTIFFVVYSSFTAVETAIQDRVERGKSYNDLHLKDLLEVVLPALSRILVNLPELIKKRWQFNSICLIIRKLLHPENNVKLKQFGIKLLTLWVQGLQENAGDACMELFASAVPHFPPHKTPMGLPAATNSAHSATSVIPPSLSERYGTYSSKTSLGRQDSAAPLLKNTSSVLSGGSLSRGDVVCQNVIYPLAPAPSIDDSDLTLELMEHLLRCLTSTVDRLHWTDPSQYLRGFSFLFFLFKLFYLACLYKDFRTEAGLYTQTPPPDIELPTASKTSEQQLQSVQEEPLDSSSSSEAPPSKSMSNSALYKRKRFQNPYRLSSVIKLDYDLSHPVYNKVKNLVLKYVLMWVLPSNQQGGRSSEPRIPGSPAPSPSSLHQKFTISGVELMRDMWLTSRDNVSLLLEVCRQGFDTPLSETIKLKKLIDLYSYWQQATQKPPELQPLFMLSPPIQTCGESTAQLTTTGVAGREEGDLTVTELALVHTPVVLSWEQLSEYEGFKPLAVQAGLQATLRMIIAHTSQVFLKEASGREELKSQCELCRKIIRLYQDIVITWCMEHDTWEYMLAVLLCMTQELLKGGPPSELESTLGGNLAGSLLKTLLVCYLRASMAITVSSRLWDNLRLVLSSLTQWKEVVVQWKQVMDSMMHILGQSVYGLNLHDLPLDRLLFEDQKRLHQRLRIKTSGAEDRISTSRMSSFSILNIQPPTASKGPQMMGGSHTPPARLPKHHTTPDLNMKRKNFPKAVSVEVATGNPPAPDDVKYVKRHSVPAKHADSSPSLPSVPETIAEMSGDLDPPPSDQNPHVKRTPKRSTSSVVDYYRSKEGHKEEEEDDVSNLTMSDVGVTPSPGAQSLPPEALFRIEMSESSTELTASGGGGGGLEKIKDMSGNDVFVNPNTLSPSPEPEKKSFDGLHTHHEDVVKDAKSAVSKRTPEHSSSDNEKQVKHKDPVSSFKRYRLRWHSRTTTETKHQKGKLDITPANDLVLRNENSRDSLTLTGEEVDKLKKRPTRSDSDSSDLHSKSEPLTLIKSVSASNTSPTTHEPPTPRFHLLHKSSSEGSIPNLLVNTDLKDSLSNYTPPPQFNKKSDQHLLLRRVVSSGGGSPPNTVTREVCVPDPFSSDIIPNSRDGVITPTAQSPARPSYKQGRPFKKAVSIAHEVSVESQRNEPLETLVEHRGSGTKSPPALIVRHTSPTPPLSPPGTQLSHGWDPVISASVWLRMLRILGNINEIQSPVIHVEAMTCLQGIWKALVDISDNSGISLGAQRTPPLPEFMPPLSILTNWVIKACSLPPEYSSGRMRAYQLLCEMFIRHWHTQASQDHLVHFYSLLHEALQPSSEMLHVAVRCGCRIFSHGLPGSTILLSDTVQACSKILSTQSGGPRNEALFLLGSLLYLPDLYSDVVLPSLRHLEPAANSGGGSGVRGEELKEKLVDILFHAAVKEPTRISRCIALYQIGLLAYSELCSGHPCRRLPEGIDILLANLQFADRGVAMCAIDVISLLCEVAPQMQQLYPSMPTRVVEALCYAIAVFLTDELEKVAWVDKVIVTLIHCLRDWVMVLSPCEPTVEGCLEEHTIKSVFEVLQAAAGSKHHAISQLFTIRNPTSIELEQLETSHSRSPRGQLTRSSQSNFAKKSTLDVQLSSDQLAVSGSGAVADGDRIQTAARSILTHLLNLFGHFPFGCGAAQMTSNIMEYHDCPSLQHMDELSTEIFDSPRLQFFSFNDRAVVTFVEIPVKLDDIPCKAKTGNFQTRVIVRDVTGKYTWDCAVLYGQESSTLQSDYPSLLSKASSMDSLSESLETTAPELLLSVPANDGLPTGGGGDPLQPPFWREYLNSDRDVLEDLLKHIETTSPECVLYPEQVGLCEPVPVVEGGGVKDEEGGVGTVEGGMMRLLMQHDHDEKQYIKEAFSLPSMQGEKASAPRHFPNILAFHHCRVFLSHLGMFSWNKRSHLDLLEKNHQLILELKHLDSIQAQCRQTYKVAVLYVAPGQEDKMSILLNSRGSREYEEFVAGLGWEVDMQTHSGYMGGLKREFCANCTLPYYATSSEEVLFHVSTRLSSKVDQKVRHLGNDEVHIVWSEHWRDYRRTIFKTQFADVLIIVYPLPNGLFRIQINKKPNVPQFGPLFDGALINRSTLSPLVRATALNALRAQRTPLIGYRGRYEERLKYIQSITSKKLMSSYEHFAENVMHPLETSNTQSAPSLPTVASLRSSPVKPSTSYSTSSLPVTVSSSLAHSHTTSAITVTSSQHHSSHSSIRPHLPHLPDTPPRLVASLLKLPSRALESARSSSPSPPMRPRSSTNDESMLKPPKSPSMSRNNSVPDSLSELGRSRSNSNHNNNSTPPIAITQVTDQSNESTSHTGFSSSSTL